MTVEKFFSKENMLMAGGWAGIGIGLWTASIIIAAVGAVALYFVYRN